MAVPQPQCAVCPYEWSERFCRHDHGKAPANCPSIRHQDLAAESLEAIRTGEVREFARQASIQEAEGYCNRGKGYGAVRPAKPPYQKVRTVGLVAGACRACATKMGTAEAAKAQSPSLLDDMHGHPGMARFREAGFDVITF
jgi:hypothetical protein